MTDFLIYQGKAAVALAVFYMFYRLLLSKETFHRFNRIVLLGTAALSFILPLCVITFKKVVVLPAMTASSETVVSEVTGTAVTMVPEASEPIWPIILCIIFCIGALTVLANTVISIIGIRRIISSGSSQTLESGETLIITETDTAPFSWMKYIVISREDYESGYSQILTHEKAHIALRHSSDILFVDMITALQWFNPAIWMLKADLRALHEFEADDAVLRSGANIKEYQYLLIRKAVSKSGYSVANSFNHSTLKARITMMLNKKSSRMSAWKALYVIPLVGISLAATAETKVDYQYEGQEPVAAADTLKARVVKVHNTPDGKDNKNSFREKNLSEGRFIIDEEAGSVTMIYFDHNGNELRSQHKGMPLGQDEYYFHNGNMATPAAYEIYLKEEGAVTFTTYRSNGKKILGIVTPNNNYVTGVWDATKHPDEQETVYHMKGKQYKVRGGKYIEIEESQKSEEKKVIPFQLVAQKPGFNGGDANEFSKWVSENVRYPEKCRQSRVQGRVTLQFTVTEEGKVRDVKVLRSVNDEMDKEAVRVVSESPLWTPGRDENGEVVPVKYVFPVIFQLPDSKE
ncbi:MAG: M56 family metallopeptidase [Bacteroidales bacterium]|nr:M56 family metallopeptidase [Bacteroidales bacterium]